VQQAHNGESFPACIIEEKSPHLRGEIKKTFKTRMGARIMQFLILIANNAWPKKI
jgi:hypothetical protein